MPIEVAYFLCVGILVLAPMFVWAIYLTGREIASFRPANVLARMRVRRIKGQDWLWTIGTFIGLSGASFLIAKVLMPRLGLDATPFFFRDMPLTPDRRWIIGVWPAECNLGATRASPSLCTRFSEHSASWHLPLAQYISGSREACKTANSHTSFWSSPSASTRPVRKS